MNKKILFGLVIGLTVGVLGALALFNSPPVNKVSATTLPICISDGPQCGTQNGHRDNFVCPATYSEHEGQCRKRVYMERPFVWSCPSGYDEHGGSCRKCTWSWKGTCYNWDYKNKEKDYQNCPSGWGINEDNHTQCKKWDVTPKVNVPVVCQTGTVQYDSCTPAETCPETCGYEGGTVPDGKGGTISCDPTNSCSTRRWCFPDEESETGFIAKAIPSDEIPDTGKAWESGKMIDKYCAYLPAGQCPTACGLEASEVDDGKGGIMKCDATPVCEQPKQEEHHDSAPGPSQPSAPQCTDGNTLQLPANPHVIRSGSQATVNWFETEGDEANIFFKEVDSPVWTHAVRDIKVVGGYGSVTINDLKPELGYTFGIQQKRGCAGGETVIAVIVDGPAPMVFPFSYWEWAK